MTETVLYLRHCLGLRGPPFEAEEGEWGGDFPRLNRYIQKGDDCSSPKQEEWKGRRPSVAGAQSRAGAAATVYKY